MNVKEAFNETLDLALHLEMDQKDITEPSQTYEHLQDLYARLLKAEASDAPLSETKANRWLGWAQACVVAVTDATVEDMKAINEKWKDG